MADLSVDFMGLRLKSPVILGSSTMSKTLENLKAAEREGAGAVILKSLFEEEIRQEHEGYGDDFHPEALEYIRNDAHMVYGASGYIEQIEKTKQEVSLPVIASVNCTGGAWWADYASDMESAGADAIELNIAFVPFSVKDDPRDVENRYANVLKAVKERVKIPVAAKIGGSFSSIPFMAARLKDAGADAVTLFNRYYQMSIDTNTLKLKPVHYYSSENETYNILRWVSVISSQLKIDISVSTGVHSASALLQHVLAGAKTVQVVSEIYKNGFGRISSILEETEEWLDLRKKESISDIRGIASLNSDKYSGFERVQYMKAADAGFVE
jgi:dihydroorotate dehydrogenase (fumarate)